MKLLTRVYIKKECRDLHGINEAFEKACKHIQSTYALFSLSEDDRVFIIELHLGKPSDIKL